jgi:hydroxymethylglutaryl-CoA lyase
MVTNGMPSSVKLIDVGPRDGLQNEKQPVPAAVKVELVHRLQAAGLKEIEVTSYVSPKWVPQMADGAEVVAAVKAQGVVLGGLVPNMQGLEAGLAAGLSHFGVITSASETFSQRNINATVDESMHRIRRILTEAPGGVSFRGYVSTATHCPFEGEQDPDWVAHLCETLLEWGVDYVYLGETIGKATPYHVERLLGEVLDSVPVQQLGVHFHDTYGQAIANTMTALDHGIMRMDSSAGGLGGCPYAPGATGNVATEDVIYLLDGLGIEHGVDGLEVARVAERFCAEHNLTYSSKAGRAMLASQEEA